MSSNILETIKKELRGVIRDKKSLLMMVVTPIMIPIFIFIFSYIYDDMMNSNEVDIYNVGINYSLNDIEQKIIEEANLETKYYSTKEKMQDAFDDGLIDAYIILKNNKYTVYYNKKSEYSSMASYGIETYFNNYNTYLAQNYLTNINVDLNKVYNNIDYNFEEIIGTNDLVGTIITFGFIFAIMSITLTAIYCATDSTAGEKERGTLETFLTFPIKSNELILGKYLAISISCFVTSIISLVLSITSLSICHGMFEIYKDTVFNFNFVTISLILIIMLSYSLFISGLSIAIASFSKSYKEAQSSLTPLSMIVMVPMFFDMFGIVMNPMLSFIPIVNHTLLMNDIISGNANILNILIMFVSTIIYVILIIYYIKKQYKSERILFSI